MTTSKPTLEQSYQFCQQLAKSHYENFPVASILVPKRLRQPISVIYAFARTADDFADEGVDTQENRLNKLDQYSQKLQNITSKQHNVIDPIFIALTDVIEHFNLPTQLFEDLLAAFKQDVVKSRYVNYNEVLDYCRLSANPVGRLLLHLDHEPTENQLEQSDAICTALQLINFYQDIVQDYTEQDRIYLPLDELNKYGVVETDIMAQDTTHIAELLRTLYNRAHALMVKGYPLGMSLDGRLGWEIRAMTLGGISTLNLLMKQTDDMLLTRPRLSKKTLFTLLLQSMSKRFYKHTVQKVMTMMM